MTPNSSNQDKQTRPRVSGPIRDLIRSLGHKGWTASQIREALEQKYGTDTKLPTIRTIRRHIKGPIDESGLWQVGDLGDDDALVLPVLEAIILASQGRRRYVTKATAKYIVQVHKAARYLEPFPWLLYTAAIEYQHTVESGGSTSGLDAWLAFAPWKDDEHQRRYDDALSKGWVDSPGIIAEGEMEELEEMTKRQGLTESEEETNE